MAQVTIDVKDEQQQRVRAVAAAERKSEQEIYQEAITAYLMSVRSEYPGTPDAVRDDYEPLRRMIGMVKDGPADLSVAHDVRPTDPR